MISGIKAKSIILTHNLYCYKYVTGFWHWWHHTLTWSSVFFLQALTGLVCVNYRSWTCRTTCWRTSRLLYCTVSNLSTVSTSAEISSAASPTPGPVLWCVWQMKNEWCYSTSHHHHFSLQKICKASNNQIETLPDTISMFWRTQLKEVDFSENSLKELPSYIFELEVRRNQNLSSKRLFCISDVNLSIVCNWKSKLWKISIWTQIPIILPLRSTFFFLCKWPQCY